MAVPGLREAHAIEPCYIQIEKNPNCEVVEGLVFQPRTEFRPVSHVRLEHLGVEAWYEVTGMERGGRPCPASAAMIDDSGDGSGYLVVGGAWGLRFRAAGAAAAWNVDDASQWGAPMMLVPADGGDLRFI